MFVILQVLGLSDEDAAPVHIEVGRRLSRIGFEYKVIPVTLVTLLRNLLVTACGSVS
jgi:hypothetical protein